MRLPDFVRSEDVNWARDCVLIKNKLDCSDVEFRTIEESLCVQMMHIGPYDTEIESVKLMDAVVNEQDFENDLSDTRRHHEVYISDPNKE